MKLISKMLPEEQWMKLALEMAVRAKDQNEVPIGALILNQGVVIAKGHNQKEMNNNPIHHAEICVIQEAAKKLGRWRLSDCELYVTLEPCLMCAGAIIQSRLKSVIFGAYDPKAGAVYSIYQSLSNPQLNHQPRVQGGVLAFECGEILKDFFQQKRQKKA